MSQCHDLSDYDEKTYTVARPDLPPDAGAGCHDAYGDPGLPQDDRRAASTEAAWSGTTRPRRAGRS